MKRSRFSEFGSTFCRSTKSDEHSSRKEIAGSVTAHASSETHKMTLCATPATNPCSSRPAAARAGNPLAEGSSASSNTPYSTNATLDASSSSNSSLV